MTETIFDKIIAGDIPAKKVFEDDDVLAFEDVNPQAPTHVLVIPKQKIQGFNDLDQLDSAFVGRYVTKVSLVAKELGLDKNGYRVVFNQGMHGCQSVDYIHAHIVGGRQLEWPPG